MERESATSEHCPPEQSAARYEFKLRSDRYDAFVAMLDAGSKPRGRLKRLLTEPSVLD